MKLPDQIKNVEEAKDLLGYLYYIGHAQECIGDDSHDPKWKGVCATKKEKEQLNKLMEDIYKFKEELKPAEFLSDMHMKEVKVFLGWDEDDDEGPGWKD